MDVPTTQVWQAILNRLRDRHGAQFQQFQQNHPNWQPGQFLGEHRPHPAAWQNILNQLPAAQPSQPPAPNWTAFGQPGSATVSAALPVPGTPLPTNPSGPTATSPWAGMHWGTRAPSSPVM